MSDDTIPTTPTTSDRRQAITLPAGLADRLGGQVARIERAAEFLRNYELAVPPTFARVPILPAAEAPKTEVDPGQITWQEARERLVALRREGESFTSLRDLAARVGCSEGLIRKAIKRDVGLRAWAAGSKRTRRTAPAATGLERAIHRTPQRRESSPELAAIDAEPLEDPDVALQQLIEAASPAERARIHAMTPEQRTSLLRLVSEQNSDREAPRLRKRA